MTAEWNNAALDTKTYAVDSTTGTEISNKFDYANIANYDEYSDTKYLTRNDWVGTFPTAASDVYKRQYLCNADRWYAGNGISHGSCDWFHMEYGSGL